MWRRVDITLVLFVTRVSEAGSDDLSYEKFLTWRGFLDREPPRRPDPEAYYGPPAHRTEAWKFAFVGSRCTECGFLHLPPARVCVTSWASGQGGHSGPCSRTGR